MTGTLIVFAGPPCSGKTTLAEEIARRRKIPHLQMDTTRRRIMPDSPHTRADRAVAYRAMHMAAELLVRHGVSVIVDAPYGHEQDRREIEEIVRSTGAALRWIECKVSVDTAVRRFHARGPDSIRLDLTGELVGEMVRAYRYTGSGLLLETEAAPAEENFARIERFLDTVRNLS